METTTNAIAAIARAAKKSKDAATFARMLERQGYVVVERDRALPALSLSPSADADALDAQ